MQQILDTVIDYVKKENTDYALMIDGSWGSGKTYFWENTLRPEIEKQKNNDKNLKTIYISLYGVESINEISKSIFYEVYTPSNEKLKKVTQSKVGNAVSEMGKLIINVGSGLLNLNQPISENISYENLFDLENKVLCFDDLERANLDISQILGYINNFVEHDKTKVIILCNEEEISNNVISNNLELKTLVSTYVLEKEGKLNKSVSLQEKELSSNRELINDGIIEIFDRSNNYKKIKEKLIGKTLKYEADYQYIINSIVQSLSDDNGYNNFLLHNLGNIYKTFISSKTNNIRILKQSIWDFEKIYLLSINEFPDLDIEILKRMLIFTIALSLEIKSGNHVNLFEDVNTNEELQSKLIMYKMTNKKEIPIEEEFINKYFSKSHYSFKIFFKSIKKLVKEGIVDGLCLKDELEKLSENDTTPPHYKIMRGFWELSDAEFNAALEITYTNALNGDIAFHHYLRIFVVLNHLRNMNLLKKSKREIKKDIFRGLRKAGEKGYYYEDIDITFFNIGDIQDDEDILFLKQEIININKNLLLKKQQEKVFNLIIEIKRNPNEGLKELRVEYMYNPFFCYCQTHEFFDLVKELSNSNITNLRNFIKDRHKYNDVKLVKDLNNLKKLKRYIDYYILNKNVTLSIALLNELSSTIEEVTNGKDIESRKTKKRVNVKNIRTGRKINKNYYKFRTRKRKVRKSRT